MDTFVIAALAATLAVAVLLLSRSLIGTRWAVRRLRILSEIADASDSANTTEDLLDALGDILVPKVADICLIDMLSSEGVERVFARVDSAEGEEIARRLAERMPSLPEEMIPGDDSEAPPKLRFLERITDDDLRDLAHGEEDLRFLRRVKARSVITVALRARGKRMGAVTLITAWSGRRYNRDDTEFARVLAGRVALALDNAGLFADLERAEQAKAEIAETLQRSLIPPPLPNIPGWATAAMYRPAGAENEVGGDFYDAFPIAEGWMIVIGDVTGRGARAASITAQARYTLRTAAALSGDPLVALTTLNRALLARADPSLCSVAALALADDHNSPVRMAVAGHPPPLLVNGQAVCEVATVGPVLGAMADASWTIEHVALEPGQQLVLVTDGIIEAVGEAGRFGEERLHSELTSISSPALAVQALESAVNSFTDGMFDDDAAILAVAPAPSEVGTEPRISAASLFPPPPAAPGPSEKLRREVDD